MVAYAMYEAAARGSWSSSEAVACAVRVGSDVVRDADGVAFQGLLGGQAPRYRLHDALPPRLVSFEPARGALGVPADPWLAWRFSEPVVLTPEAEACGTPEGLGPVGCVRVLPVAGRAAPLPKPLYLSLGEAVVQGAEVTLRLTGLAPGRTSSYL